jgi:hypothetical protein
MRNVLAVVPKGSQDMVASVIPTVFGQPDSEHIQKQFTEVVAMLGRSPLSRRDIGVGFGQRARWNASTKRSNGAPTSWASSPTPPPYCVLLGRF